MEDSINEKVVTPKKAKNLQKDEEAESSSLVISNGTEKMATSDLSEDDIDEPKTPTKVSKSMKTEKTKEKSLSPRKELQDSPKKLLSSDSPKKLLSSDSPTHPDVSVESFHGFDEDSSLIKQESEKSKNFNTYIDELKEEELASSSQEELASSSQEESITDVAESEGVVGEEETNVDAGHPSEAESEPMEIDATTDSSDKCSELNKDSDIEKVPVKSSRSKMTKRGKKETVKTDTAVGEETKAPILEASLTSVKVEYCGSCEAQVDDAEDGICCDGKCERWFHLRCSGLSQAEYDELSNDTNANWACSKCSGKRPPPAEPTTPAPEIVKPLINVRKDLTKTPTTPTAAAAKRKSVAKEVKTPKIDVSNPAFLKPFDYGWKRELVFRSTNESTSSAKRQGDIYYYTPKGKKLRSLREISEHVVGTDLTMDNFTFFKEPLGIEEPGKEIIRDAKLKTVSKDPSASPATPKSTVPKITKAAKEVPKVAKTTPKLTATVNPLEVPSSSSTTPVTTPTATPKVSASITPRVVLKKPATTPTLKVKFPPPKAVQKPIVKKKSLASEDELEMGMLPPMWEPMQKPKDNKGESSKRPLESPEKDLPAVKKVKIETSPVLPKEVAPATTPNFLQNISYMYTALLQAFQFLKVQELLRASRVCHLWHDVALHRDLWTTVRMKNSQVKDWEGFAATLKRVGTRNLDLRKILMPDKPEALKAMLSDCAKALSKINSLVKLDLCRCTSSFLETIAASCPQLEYISACALTKSGQVNLMSLGKCLNLTELRLKSAGGMELINMEAIEHLSKLKHVSLTTVKNMNEVLNVLGRMLQLESLELGDLTNVTDAGVSNLSHLKRLRRLRLEKGQQDCPTVKILQTISQLSTLTQLELINFDVKVGFEDALSLCTNIKILLIIPTYVTQSATTNHLVIEGVSKLSKSLNHFVWGLTTELLRVTDLFIDQWEMQKSPEAKSAGTQQKKTTNDSIPILKPSSGKDKKDGAVTQVDVLQLPKLHKVLLALLPNTKIIILKVPFCHTWRQTISGTAP